MSKMKDNMTDIFKILSTDETLLRLLYYQPANAVDDPLSSSKTNILSMTNKWDIILDRIKTIPKTDDLVKEVKCRLLFYPGKRSNTRNYLLAGQEIVFDIMTHFLFEEVDLRQESIIDRINELICNQKVAGVGDANFKGGGQIPAPEMYVGFRVIYLIGSTN